MYDTLRSARWNHRNAPKGMYHYTRCLGGGWSASIGPPQLMSYSLEQGLYLKQVTANTWHVCSR